jgi:hypothetical protein
VCDREGRGDAKDGPGSPPAENESQEKQDMVEAFDDVLDAKAEKRQWLLLGSGVVRLGLGSGVDEV